MITFIIGAVLIFGFVLLLSYFWKEIKSFLQKAFELFMQKAVPALEAGMITYLEKGSIASGVYIAIQKFLEKEPNGNWKETGYQREISVNELPKNIRQKMENAYVGEEVDITSEMQQELKLEVK